VVENYLKMKLFAPKHKRVIKVKFHTFLTLALHGDEQSASCSWERAKSTRSDVDINQDPVCVQNEITIHKQYPVLKC